MNRYAPLYIGTAGQSDELTPELARSKAALIWQMTRLGLNVPPAFVLPTELCAPVNRNDPQALAVSEILQSRCCSSRLAAESGWGQSRTPIHML